jgi:hypothetical protein
LRRLRALLAATALALLAVRVLGADETDTMRGELHLEDGETERRHFFELVRLAATAGS